MIHLNIFTFILIMMAVSALTCVLMCVLQSSSVNELSSLFDRQKTATRAFIEELNRMNEKRSRG